MVEIASKNCQEKKFKVVLCFASLQLLLLSSFVQFASNSEKNKHREKVLSTNLSAPSSKKQNASHRRKHKLTKKSPLSHEPPVFRNGSISFIHIGKSGGTSVDFIFREAAKMKNFKYNGFKHFDISYAKRYYPTSQLAVMFRDPVERAVSHYYFLRQQSWTKGTLIRNQKIDDFLKRTVQSKNWADMMEFRGFWQDGGLNWLTSTHIGAWVNSSPRKPWNDDRKDLAEKEQLNYSRMMQLAASKLDSMLWIGIKEDFNRSVELLEHQLGLPWGSLPIHHFNKNKHQNVATKVRKLLEPLTTVDAWLYKYALAVFEARYAHYKTGKWSQPKLPEIIAPKCRSTRFIINCTNDDVYGTFRWISREATINHRLLFESLI